MKPPVFHLSPGKSPLLISIPHAGTRLPAGMAGALTSPAGKLPDTDWFVDRLYDFAHDCGAGLLLANYSRYVIDLNRPPDDEALYARATTSLCPLVDFHGNPIYRPGHEPDAAEVADRLMNYWQPYHQRLDEELTALRQRFGFCILLDAHSIAGRLPMLFEGRLPDLNLGSNDGSSAHPGLVARAAASLEAAPAFTTVLDGRFKGGYITRCYGRPREGRHALQLELSQDAYLEPGLPRAFNKPGASALKDELRRFVDTLMDWRPAGHES